MCYILLICLLDIAPFNLYPNDEEPYLCPVRAIVAWRTMSEHSRGYVFRKRMNWNNVSDVVTDNLVRNTAAY